MRFFCFFAVFLAVAAAGCGFRPVNAPGTDTGASPVAKVRVQPIPNRIGQVLHTELTRRFDAGAAAAYYLAVDLSEQIGETGFRADETATRRNIQLTAGYRLIDARTGKPVLEGEVRSTNSANILDQPFATKVAERDARLRGTDDLAAKIFRDVASKLAAR